MGMKIGQPENGELGKRDAFHVPAVLVRWVGAGIPLPGAPVKFIDDTFKEVKAGDEDDRHAIIDPFVRAIDIQGNINFWVLLVPDVTAELSHNFKININDVPHVEIEQEQEDDYDYDDGCKGCW